jgi:PAS domain S-box-containing protein
MKKLSDMEEDDILRNKIMGLGERSMRKSYYPELQKRIRELEEMNEQLRSYISEKEETQKAVIENEALLSDVINFQPAGTYRIRLNRAYDLKEGAKNPFTIDFVSKKFLDIAETNEPRETFNNPLQIIRIIHPEDREGFLHMNDVAIKNFTSFSWEGRFLINGQEKWVQIESHPRLLDNGDKVWTGVLIDLSARKKSEEALRISEERFRLIFESSPVGIISYDENGIIKACNENFARIFNIDQNRLMGMNALLLPHKRIVDALNKALKGENSVFEGELLQSFGSPAIQVRLQFAPIFGKNAALRGGVGIIENITERIRNGKLEQEIVIARKSAEFKQNFLANMSHEIRTPLTGIEGMANILNNTYLTETQQDYLDTIITSSKSLRTIINQILDYSKIEAGHMTLKPKPIYIPYFLKKINRLLESFCNGKIPFSIEASPGMPDCIEADEHKILQIITNLVSNAVKYAPEGSITVKMTQMATTRNGQLRFKISVTDQGAGISEELQKNLFTPFSQLERNDLREVEGTGLGLSISKQLANVLGGCIGLLSFPGNGSTFWFTFKASASPVNSHVLNIPEKSPVPHKMNLNILLVEDKKINQKVITLILEGLGHSVTVADNGQNALEIFKPHVFDLILMDVQMPVMDGITATRHLRERHSSGIPPVVGLSANAFEGDREKYMNRGLDDYLTKPVNTDDFNRLIGKWFL